MAKRKNARAKATRKATTAARKPAKKAAAKGARAKGASASSRAGKKKTAARATRKAAPKKAVKKALKKVAKKAPKKTLKAAAKKAAPKRAKALKPAKAVKAAKTIKKAAKVSKAPVKASPAKATKAVKAAPKVKRSEPSVDRPSIPSSLTVDRTASQARSGGEEMREQLKEHTESSPVLTAGDVDADWEQAYSSGDEAPGGDNPTPDQDRVDEIGRALGVEYQDGEELKGADKISDRDKHRWELDPASAEDYPDHDS